MAEVTGATADAPPRRFRPYSEYRDSGVKWLGQVPAHWEVKPVKAGLVRNDSGVWGEDFDDDGTIVLRSTEQTVQGGWRIDQPARRRLGAREATCARLGVGDLLVTKSSGSAHHLGKTSVVDEAVAALNCCFSNFMQRLRVSAKHVPQFFWYFMNSPVARQQLVFLSSTTTGLGNLNGSILGAVRMTLAPPDEQHAITTFLDRETAKIDALVARKERLIELLQEKRTALITRAVTRGLNPNVPMKDSGVEWLGEIPAHWETLALGRVAISRCDGPFGSGLKSEHYSESGIRVVRLQNIGWAEFINSDAAYLDEAYALRLGDHSVREEDILIAGLGDDGHPVGRACVAPVEIEPAMVKADCFRFRLDRQRVLSRYAAFQLSATASAVAGSHATGATRTRMNLAASAKRKIALPPPKEQRAIAIFLDRETAKTDTLVGKVSQATDHLREFRAALISAAVTGKIDVREAMPR